MMHDSDSEAAAHIGRYKRNLMGSSRTIEIEIPRVLSEFICYQEVSGVRVNLKRTLIGNPPYCIKNTEIG